jgi:hypothetical protein
MWISTFASVTVGDRRTDRERKTFHVETAPRPFFARSSLDWTPFSQEHAGTPTWQGSFVRSSLQTFLFKTKLQTFLSEVPSDILAQGKTSDIYIIT